MSDPQPDAQSMSQTELLAEFQRQMVLAQWPDHPDQDRLMATARGSLNRYAKLLPWLLSSGWIKSLKAKRPVDRHGCPLPWYTYPAIDFLSEKDLSALTVFEFGSGGSTLWWAGRARHVTSVEHAEPWAEEMRPRLPANVEYHFEALEPDGAYARKAAGTGRTYDVVVIDGRDRVNCCRHSIDALTDRGVVVWDNAERSRYRPGFQLLAERGFRRLNLHGLGPINGEPWLTSIFYRDGNCLGL